jgi:hypothetical protein
MAGKSQFLATDGWASSSVTEKKLEELVADGLLRPKTSRSRPEWIAPPSTHREPAPPEGYVVSFVSFHERGFGIPSSVFMRALLHYYRVELHHLAPNAIAQAAIFAAVCEGYLGVEPQWNLWLHLFKAELFARNAGGKGAFYAVRVGSCVLQLRSSRTEQYIPARLISSNSGWHSGWFYLRNDDNQLPRYTGRVLTAREDRWVYGVPDAEKPRLDPLLAALQQLRARGLTAAGVATAFHRRRVMPLCRRRLRLDQMTPEASLEGSRMSHEALTVEEGLRRARRMVGTFQAEEADRLPMRPTEGFEPVVSLLVRLFFSSIRL